MDRYIDRQIDKYIARQGINTDRKGIDRLLPRQEILGIWQKALLVIYLISAPTK